jgi:hypothetical protein
MASPYSVTVASESIAVEHNHGATTLTVTNTTKQELTTRFDIRTQPPTKADWLAVDRPLRPIGPGTAEQVKVTIAAPADQEGTFAFQVVAVSWQRPQDDFTVSPAVAFTLKKDGAPVAPPPGVRWWMILIPIAIVVFAGIGVGAYLHFRPVPVVPAPTSVSVPDVVSLKLDTAIATLKKAGLLALISDKTPGSPLPAVVITQNPLPKVVVPPGEAIMLVVKH